MKVLVCIVLPLMLFGGIGDPLIVHATSFNPVIEEHHQLKEKTVMKTGATVYLFHSGTQDVKNAIVDNDILAVYRESSSCEQKEVGKIRIRSHAGDNFVMGEVMKGEIKEGDIAKKGAVGLLVIFPEDKCGH
jgi:hypothetical protein